MAITKRFSVKFDLKVVAGTEDFASFQKELVELTKRFLSSKNLSGFELEKARIAAEFGPEAALEMAIKSGVALTLREELTLPGASLGNIQVVVKS